MDSEVGDSRTRFFGTRLTPVSFEQWIQLLDAQVAAGTRRYLSGHHNLHSLYLLDNDPEVRSFYARCDHCYIDGVPVRWIASVAGIPGGAAQRFSLMDRLPDLFRAASERGWSVFYLGSAEDVVARARARFRRQFPRLRVHFQHGYFDTDEAVVAQINAVRPDLLLVGMGMPLQESWVNRNLDRLDVGVVTQAGATLDYFGEGQAKPPRWMSNAGLAWLHRLSHDPRRLWRRYLVEPWKLVLPVSRLLGRRP